MGAVCERPCGGDPYASQPQTPSHVPTSPKVGSPAVSLRRCNTLSPRHRRRLTTSTGPPPSPHPRREGSFFDPAGVQEEPEPEQEGAETAPESSLPLLDSLRHTRSFHVYSPASCPTTSPTSPLRACPPASGPKLDGNLRLTFKVRSEPARQKTPPAARYMPLSISMSRPLRPLNLNSRPSKPQPEAEKDPRETIEHILNSFETGSDEDHGEGRFRALRRTNTMPCTRGWFPPQDRNGIHDCSLATRKPISSP
eukprot:EG_transcript_22658